MLICCAASLVFAVPIRVFGLAPPEPVFALVPAFAWAMIRPSILPPIAVLILGLFLDALWGGPLGLWPLCLLAAYGSVLFARAFLSGQDFLVMWGGYAGACAIAMTTGLVCMRLETGASPSLVGAGWQFLASAALFPFAWRLIERYESADARFR
jgi:rod shape-determining protein MreD